MNLWERRVVPHLVRWACGQEPVRRQRAKVVPLARGRVLELGVGSGLNLPHYDPARVERVLGIDPSEPLLEDAAREAARAPFAAEVAVGTAEALPVEDGSVDSVLVTYTLCSVADLDRALGEIRRALAHGGALYFSEHGLAPDRGVRALQRALEPAWKRAGGGCHLTRDLPARLRAAGYSFERLDAMYLPGPRPLTWNTWGVARPA